ncbi:zinc-ribbon and DUF3426 domain-containing protein [Methyloglobulus sp.]|uniref:zinc-ribbon and DUF3426 domain-containing protein n=1 Tax=Methyloglobulus sp. TaxID=2518622 RepID=UPI0039898858
MFTQCPDCRKTYPLNKGQLRGKKTLIYCSDCSKKFNALELLNEKPTGLIAEAKAEFIAKADPNHKPRSKKKLREDRQQAKINIGTDPKKNNPDEAAISALTTPSATERLPWEVEKTPVNVNWRLGFIMASLLLVGQIIYFESGSLSQNTSYRPQLEKLCRWLGCQLPDYENLAEFAVLQSSFAPNSDNTIAFKAVINNQAPFKQRLPNIKLTLLNYNEQLFAQRIFAPKDYLTGKAHTNFSIAPDETVEARLIIAAPETGIGGYNFDLIY